MGLQLGDRFIIGGQIADDYFSDEEARSGLGLFSRYYFNSSENKFRPYAQVDFSTQLTLDFVDELGLTAGLEVQLKPGIIFNNEFSRRLFYGYRSADNGSGVWRLRGYIGNIASGKNNKSPFKKGDFLISSELYEIDFSSPSDRVNDFNRFRVSPTFIYALSSRWLLEFDLNIEDNTSNFDNFVFGAEQRVKSTIITAEAGLRYIILPNSAIKPYGRVGVFYQSDFLDGPDEVLIGRNSTESLTSPFAGAGLLIPVKGNAFIDANLNVQRETNFRLDSWEVSGEIKWLIKF
ncbi:MAG: hypothetical protein AAF741_13905 [Bacteroidota bacterium]